MSESEKEAGAETISFGLAVVNALNEIVEKLEKIAEALIRVDMDLNGLLKSFELEGEVGE